MLFQMTLFCGTNIYKFSAVKWLVVINRIQNKKMLHLYIKSIYIFDIIDMKYILLYIVYMLYCKYM